MIIENNNENIGEMHNFGPEVGMALEEILNRISSGAYEAPERLKKHGISDIGVMTISKGGMTCAECKEPIEDGSKVLVVRLNELNLMSKQDKEIIKAGFLNRAPRAVLSILGITENTSAEEVCGRLGINGQSIPMFLIHAECASEYLKDESKLIRIVERSINDMIECFK